MYPSSESALPGRGGGEERGDRQASDASDTSFAERRPETSGIAIGATIVSMDREFHASRTTTGLLVLGSVAFVAAGLWFAGVFGDPPRPLRIPEPAVTTIGWVAIVFFGLCGAYLVWRLASPKPAVVLREDVLIDNASLASAGSIPWVEITGSQVVELMGQRFLGIHLRDPQRLLAQQPAVKRKGMESNLHRFGCPVTIPANAVSDFDGLVTDVSHRLGGAHG